MVTLRHEPLPGDRGGSWVPLVGMGRDSETIPRWRGESSNGATIRRQLHGNFFVCISSVGVGTLERLETACSPLWRGLPSLLF